MNDVAGEGVIGMVLFSFLYYLTVVGNLFREQNQAS